MSYDLMFQKAIELQNSGALNEAENIYLKILQAMPENSDAWNLLGLIAQSKGNLAQAEDCFLAAIKFAPAPFSAHFFNLGLTYKALGKRADAAEAFNRAVALQPDLKEGWNFLGIIQAENGDMAAAAKSFCQALEADNGYNEARANLCFYTNDKKALFQLADEEEQSFAANERAAAAADDMAAKERYLRRAVAAEPYRTDGLLALARLLAESVRAEEALKLYHKVLNLDENSVEAILGAADIYLAQGVLDKTESYYKKSFALTREIAGAHLNYGILLYRQKRFNEALEEYRAATALAPQRPEISYNLALILKETGDLEEALGLMFNAHLLAPERGEFAAGIMETLTELFENNAELALKIAENWQRQEPDNPFSQRILAGMLGDDTAADGNKYAEQLFDAFADTYDAAIEKLEPQIIAKFKELHGDIAGRALDLGCGTGLAAAALKNDKNRFDGVDISAKMLDKARQRGLYGNLFQADIAAFLQENPAQGKYDLALAFDVFCYMGELGTALRQLSGVETWFTVEAADEARGKDFYLTANGRYKHTRNYVEKTLAAAGFREIRHFPLTLRQENGTAVAGFMFAAK